MNPANETTEQVYQYIKSYIKKLDIAPTVDEIGEACGVSKGTASYHLDKLEAEGRIARQWYKSRSIRLTKSAVSSDVVTEEVYEIILEGIKQDNLAPSQREIAAACHISRPTVQLHLKRLVAQGKIIMGSGHRQMFLGKNDSEE